MSAPVGANPAPPAVTVDPAPGILAADKDPAQQPQPQQQTSTTQDILQLSPAAVAAAAVPGNNSNGNIPEQPVKKLTKKLKVKIRRASVDYISQSLTLSVYIEEDRQGCVRGCGRSNRLGGRAAAGRQWEWRQEEESPATEVSEATGGQLQHPPRGPGGGRQEEKEEEEGEGLG